MCSLVKGGAATFGFADVAELTHQMESLLISFVVMNCSPMRQWSTCCWSRLIFLAACSHGTKAGMKERRLQRRTWSGASAS